ncbi:MAG: NAD(+)/NADH kinase [Candidatus Stahlbacteria bacterium]|nr:NAD(+)/NADH kinase [Candidatus Stahlbacteria bacterium]
MKIGIIANPNKSMVKSVFPELIQWLVQQHQEVWIAEENELPIERGLNSSFQVCAKFQDIVLRTEVILAMGGDGTLLKAAHIVGASELPILGINLGGLGFLTEVGVDEMYSALTKLIDSQYILETRMVLESSIGDDKFYGLNDIVITGIGGGRMLHLVVWVDGNYLSHFSSDGMIFSTPTGSTAYSLAALGPILHPATEAIVLNFICPHTLGARPIVVGADAIIEAKCENSDATVVIDGQDKVLVNKNKKIIVRRANYKVNLIKAGTRNFYELLRTKLKWGGGKER